MGKSSGEAMAQLALVAESLSVKAGLSSKDVEDGKTNLTAEEVAAKSDVPAVPVGKAHVSRKCINPATCEPVSARREEFAVLPVDGSRTGSADGNGTGTCPHCGGNVPLSKKGFLTAHTVRKAPVPATPPRVRLVERQAPVTDSGARAGSPDAAMRTRGAELSGVAGTGTVKVSAKVVGGEVKARVKDVVAGTVSLVVLEGVSPRVFTDGGPAVTDGKPARSKIIEVPVTEANVRTALRQEQGKRQRKDKKTGLMVGGPDPARCAMLGSMLRGLTGSTAVYSPGEGTTKYRPREAVTLDSHGLTEDRGREHGDGVKRVGHVPTSRGPAMAPGRTAAAIAGPVAVRRVTDTYERPETPDMDAERVTGKGKPRNAVGWSEPVGRERPDSVATGKTSPLPCAMADPERVKGVKCTVAGCTRIAGDYGWLTCAEYRELTARQQNTYWKTVGKKRRAAEARKDAAPDVRKGERLAPGYGHAAETYVTRMERAERARREARARYERDRLARQARMGVGAGGRS